MNMISATLSPAQGNAVILSPIESSVVRTLLYFEIFNHPLECEEIIHCLGMPVREPERIRAQIRAMAEKGYIREHDGYFMIHCPPETIIRRTNGEKLARQSLKTAKRFSSIIARFPFVRAISLSGSISKYYMDEKSDIDYFIITTPGRMWVARTLLVLFKKIFLLNSKKYFCVNYFITEESLELVTRNIYSAMELSSIIPTYNYALYQQLMLKNKWAKEYFPNFPGRGNEWVIRQRNYLVKPILEKAFHGKAGEWLDSLCYRMTLRHWKKKFSHFDESTFDHRLRNGRNESKHHPLGYQQLVLQELSKKIQQYELKHKVSLS